MYWSVPVRLSPQGHIPCEGLSLTNKHSLYNDIHAPMSNIKGMHRGISDNAAHLWIRFSLRVCQNPNLNAFQEQNKTSFICAVVWQLGLQTLFKFTRMFPFLAAYNKMLVLQINVVPDNNILCDPKALLWISPRLSLSNHQGLQHPHSCFSIQGSTIALASLPLEKARIALGTASELLCLGGVEGPHCT